MEREMVTGTMMGLPELQASWGGKMKRLLKMVEAAAEAGGMNMGPKPGPELEPESKSEIWVHTRADAGALGREEEESVGRREAERMP
jgi:hypothetical protein